MTVFANGLEIACKKQGNKIIASFPNVCLTPPENPATPPGVPVPYPSFGVDSDTDKGTGSVKIGNETISQKNLHYYSKTSGTEAGCAAKKGVVTSKNTGKAYALAWSGNVKADGEPVSRFTDLATTNHAGGAVGNDPPNVHVGEGGGGDGDGGGPPQTECPCCHVSPAHPHQLDAEGNLLPTVPEAEYYERRYQNGRGNFAADVAASEAQIPRLEEQFIRAPAAAEAAIGNNLQLETNRLQQRREALADFDGRYQNLRDARNAPNPCPNLHNPPDQDCGVHFDRTGAPPMPEPADLGYTEEFGQEFKREWDRTHGTNVATGVGGHENRNNHMTPLSAGGCPTGTGNIIPHQALSEPCQELDNFQGELQGFG
ncbi:DUF4150 domain-containing protein [Mesorhizobium sp. YC-39]|uniref:DUF4150 domain-containing protein n=1 Tax=unclassified Mesorhizobium TaxID=325217 RepID=UPI0021E6FABF|nr:MULTISPECIES: DUF4150 domain-containing protein [unclassified Mesorhizobium]MCV3207161.1 DUF4150 domain-containing protein [Mesorhizobium sp. YC-2]MCV3228888.1 DUF4150 domain-containing protein [Mesorhizobium sp. YC-39]